MPRDIEYDFFVSYASADNREGWVDTVVNELVAEHARFTGGRVLKPFLDRADIRHLSHWHAEIFNKGLARSRFFLAFLSPNYFASEVCRKEWRAWIEQEISLHILTGGAAPIYFVEVPGFLSKPMLPEHEVAAKVAELCGVAPSQRFTTDLCPVVKEARRRQLVNLVLPLKNAGVKALQEADLKATLAALARHIEERVEETKRADASTNRVSPYNTKFTGRLDELLELRTLLTDNRAGVIAGIHGLGGIGKTELAYTYSHAYGSIYPGGRFEVKCEYQTSLRDAVTITLGGYPEFRDLISDEERKQPEAHFTAVTRVLTQRLDALGSVLLVLDNVSDLKLLEGQQTDQLTVLGPRLHLLATTRLPGGKLVKCLTLGEMKPGDALALLDKFRPFQTDEDRTAAESIVRQLGGFALAIELVAAKLAVTESATYAGVADGLGLADLDTLAEDESVELRRHNHEKRLAAVLGPTLAALKPEERRAMDFAALLPPDNVPLPWLKTLVTADFPALATATKWGDPWLVLVDRLTRLGLFTPVQAETTSTRQVKVHRLVQELLRREMTAGGRAKLDEAITDVVRARGAALEDTANWVEAVWELDPLEELAKLWDERKVRRRGAYLGRVGRLRGEVAEYGRAEPLLRRAIVAEEQRYGSDHPEVAFELNNLAEVLRATNRFAEAESLYRRAADVFETAFGPTDPDLAKPLNNLAELFRMTNRFAEAEPLYRRALGIWETKLGLRHPQTAFAANNLGIFYLTTNRYAEAEPLLRRALDALESAFGVGHSHVAKPLSNLAALLQRTNRPAEAESLLRRSLSVAENSLGADHPLVALALNNLGNLLKDTSRVAEAEALLGRALRILESRLPEHHPDIGTAVGNLAELLMATNRLAEAEPLVCRALTLAVEAYGADHHQVGTCLNNLGQLLKRANRPTDAEPVMRRALEIDETSLGPAHPNVARDLGNLGQLLQDTKRLAEAEPLMRRAIAINEASFGPDHPDVAGDLNNLATLFVETSRVAEAELLMRRALAIITRSQGPDHPDTLTGRGNLEHILAKMRVGSGSPPSTT